MAIPWGIIALLFGFLYGALTPGRQDKGGLLLNGLWIGLIVAVVLALIGFFAGYPALGVGGFVGIMVSALVLSVLFVLGAWVGDLITARRRVVRRRH